MHRVYKRAALCFLLVGLSSLSTACGQLHAGDRSFKSERLEFVVRPWIEGLEHPWGLVFLPGGDALVTERTGKLRMVQNGRLLDQPVSGVPDIEQQGQGGLLGIALHPDFTRNQLVYLAYTGEVNGKYNTEVLRGRLQDAELKEVETIFSATPKVKGGRHFGARLVFGSDDTLYVSLGDRGYSTSLCREHPAQQLDSHIGTLIRIQDDGSVPADNPFANHPDARPEIYTWGNRNMQGMARHPETQEIWTHEHGPQGGDEINIMRAGSNYGWPVITYGANYGSGSKICEGRQLKGMEQPVHYWVPSIAPSGMVFYTGGEFSAWQGNLFVGSLKFGQLVRLELDGNRIVHEERLLDDKYGRIRDVVEGPGGKLYLLTDSANGAILRISQAK